MSSTVQLDITHLTLPPINLTADDVQAKFVTFKGSFQQEVKKIHNTPNDGNTVRREKQNGRKGGVRMRWSDVNKSQVATLLFLLDNGDKTTGATEKCSNINTNKAEEVRDTLEAVLRDPTHNFDPLVDLLQQRHNALDTYTSLLYTTSLHPGTPAADRLVRKEDEDLLVFVYVCRSLDLDHHHNLHQKACIIQDSLDLTQEEVDGNFYIYAENLRMKRLCAALSEDQVVRLSQSVTRKFLTDKSHVQINNITAETLKAKEGLKETLFFYIIRQLELHDKLNRIYTNRLEELLHELGGLEEWTEALEQYPAECRPAGHCVVFCVKKKRKGADGELDKVRQVFHKSLGYTLTIEEDPTPPTFDDTLLTLQRPKYRFYDSLVVWVMAHGTLDKLELADGSHIEKQDIIDRFSKLDNFRKKPKIFFMASCQGRDTISIIKRGGVPVTVDGANKGDILEAQVQGSFYRFSTVPERCLNITAVAYQMDRLVAHATLPNHYAFRQEDGGSLYVDYVCRLLERNAGHNLTLVLERVCNKMHQILFSSNESKFEGEAKQACYYETTFQKTFVVPEVDKEGGDNEEKRGQ
ncbi:hypothetical protein Pmani_029225 [Petrolisthes manimaculis]|uniref:Caspase-8 n=1 Tax=Petrolisthes manimaculis TaxID=1843537 RepID=A0AAE1NZ49_9EUCA|nr:hypothetical protein Pmani_029225 [Petrolisthes manimaculis]